MPRLRISAPIIITRLYGPAIGGMQIFVDKLSRGARDTDDSCRAARPGFRLERQELLTLCVQRFSAVRGGMRPLTPTRGSGLG